LNRWLHAKSYALTRVIFEIEGGVVKQHGTGQGSRVNSALNPFPFFLAPHGDDFAMSLESIMHRSGSPSCYACGRDR
jgi:hypothetical protein